MAAASAREDCQEAEASPALSGAPRRSSPARLGATLARESRLGGGTRASTRREVKSTPTKFNVSYVFVAVVLDRVPWRNLAEISADKFHQGLIGFGMLLYTPIHTSPILVILSYITVVVLSNRPRAETRAPNAATHRGRATAATINDTILTISAAIIIIITLIGYGVIAMRRRRITIARLLAPPVAGVPTMMPPASPWSSPPPGRSSCRLYGLGRESRSGSGEGKTMNLANRETNSVNKPTEAMAPMMDPKRGTNINMSMSRHTMTRGATEACGEKHTASITGIDDIGKTIIGATTITDSIPTVTAASSCEAWQLQGVINISTRGV